MLYLGVFVFCVKKLLQTCQKGVCLFLGFSSANIANILPNIANGIPPNLVPLRNALMNIRDKIIDEDEVEDAEDAIYNNDVPDITDLINKIVEDLSDK